jgi:plasmid stabilization system protein ParE
MGEEGGDTMTTEKQSQAAKRNIKKAQEVWRSMSSGARARAQPEGSGRAKPGSTGEGEYYHIEVRPTGQFATFRTHDVGKKGGIQRVAGKRRSGSWDDQKWLISKEHAHVEDGKLIADTGDAREVLAALGSEPVRVTGDRFQAKPRPNVPEEKKPTPAQRRAQQQNIKKAQAARRTA